MQSILLYAVLGGLILLALGALFAPIRFAYKAMVHVTLGFVGLLLTNYCGAIVGVTIGVNILNTLVVAVLGPSGIALLLLLSWSLT